MLIGPKTLKIRFSVFARRFYKFFFLKIVANQDKSSKLITDLRTRISILESQLLEYQQGKRLLNEDGEELLNDQYTENLYLKV